jgi:hypothetical protein
MIIGAGAVINMNNQVAVKLTAYGEDILAKHYDDMCLPGEYRSKADKTGCYSFHLWELMKIFGECFHMGMLEVPFMGNAFALEIK